MSGCPASWLSTDVLETGCVRLAICGERWCGLVGRAGLWEAHADLWEAYADPWGFMRNFQPPVLATLVLHQGGHSQPTELQNHWKPATSSTEQLVPFEHLKACLRTRNWDRKPYRGDREEPSTRHDTWSLKRHSCVDCRMDLALLALDRLLPTIPGKFPILSFSKCNQYWRLVFLARSCRTFSTINSVRQLQTQKLRISLRLIP